MVKLYSLAALMQKSTTDKNFNTTTTTVVINGYKVCNNENEAKGWFLTECKNSKPDWFLVEILCSEVSLEEIEKVSVPTNRTKIFFDKL